MLCTVFVGIFQPGRLPGVMLSGMGSSPEHPPLPNVYGPPGIYNFISMVLKLCEARVGLHQEVRRSCSLS
jgi:hypothetical protein